MRRTLLLACVLLAVVAAPVAADDDRTHFRRTTPRATLEQDDGVFTLGVPSGRAWGIESELRPLPAERALAVRLVVADDEVREAFARVAYYATWRLTRRPARWPTGFASWRACEPAPSTRRTRRSKRV